MSRVCECGKQPFFNFPGVRPGIRCAECKEDGMVDVYRKKCACGIVPYFNILGEKRGEYCDNCKKPGMVNVVAKKCPCGKQRSFNYPWIPSGEFCDNCKTDGMVNVIAKKCACGKQRCFNYPWIPSGECCDGCKKPGMTDVIHKKCPCGKTKNFNFPGITPGECCFECKSPGMIHIYSKVCPGYNNAQCPVRTALAKGQKYCISCDPNEDRRKRFKLYENAFFDYVKDKLDVYKREFHVSFDPNETSFKFARLDGVVFGDGVIVCLEVDENGHRNYDCDDHRMDLVSAELLLNNPGNDISWVRVNPTVKARDQWSRASKKIREKRFQEVVDTVNEILETRGCNVKYIGFENC